jgi:YbbR domain-containing protein
VDMSGLAAGEQSNVPVIVERNRSGLARLTLTSDPAFLSFRLEQEITRTVPLTVEVTGSVPFSFEKGKPRLTQDGRPVDSVLVRGPQSRVDRVSTARVVADIDRLTGNYSSPRPVEILSQDGQEIAGVTAEPASIDVLVPIASSAGIKRVPVVPRLVGAPASGQIVSTVSVDPQFVQLTGGSDALNGIESIETFAVDIAGATHTISRTVAMRVPANTSLALGEPAVATVLVEIRPIDRPFQITLPVPIQVTDAADGLLVTLSPNSIQIKLEGNATALGAFDPASLQGTVSARTLGEGTYAIIPSFQLPAGVRLAEPAPKVTVTLHRPPTPQPTAPPATQTPVATPEATPTPTTPITSTQTISGTPTAAPTATPGQ